MAPSTAIGAVIVPKPPGWISGHDRAGLERLLRYCARPPFALERIEQVNEDQIVYRLPEPQRDGLT